MINNGGAIGHSLQSGQVVVIDRDHFAVQDKSAFCKLTTYEYSSLYYNRVGSWETATC